MLNCCIEHRRRHENEATSSLENSLEQDEDGDEFYECSSTLPAVKSDGQPEGRLKPCGDLKLLNSDEILYIPVTQVLCSRGFFCICFLFIKGMSAGHRRYAR